MSKKKKIQKITDEIFAGIFSGEGIDFDKYLNAVAMKCDIDFKFEKKFFEDYFEMYCDKFGLEKMCNIFGVTVELEGIVPDENCKQCIEENNEEQDDESSFMQDGVVYTEFFNTETIQVRSIWEQKKELNVIGNTEHDIKAELHNEDEENFVYITCKNKNPFIDRFVEHVSILPEYADLSTVRVVIKGGIVYIGFDTLSKGRKEPVQLSVFAVQ